MLRAPALGFVLPLGLLFAARLYGAPWLSWERVARSVALRARPRSSCRVSCRVFCACDRPCPRSSGWRRRARGVDRVTLAAAVCEPPRLVARGICFDSALGRSYLASGGNPFRGASPLARPFPSRPPLPGRTIALTLNACRAGDLRRFLIGRVAAARGFHPLFHRRGLPSSLRFPSALVRASCSLRSRLRAHPRFPSPLWARFARPRHASPRVGEYVQTSWCVAFPLAAGANLAGCPFRSFYAAWRHLRGWGRPAAGILCQKRGAFAPRRLVVITPLRFATCARVVRLRIGCSSPRLCEDRDRGVTRE